jgi:hypothetical protein
VDKAVDNFVDCRPSTRPDRRFAGLAKNFPVRSAAMPGIYLVDYDSDYFLASKCAAPLGFFARRTGFFLVKILTVDNLADG